MGPCNLIPWDQGIWRGAWRRRRASDFFSNGAPYSTPIRLPFYRFFEIESKFWAARKVLEFTSLREDSARKSGGGGG